MTDPLRASLSEQLTKMRGPGPLPEPLLNIVSETAHGVTVIRPGDWEELRHEEGGAGRGVPYWAILWPAGRALADTVAAEPDLAGKRVLELGCGIGLPSVIAAHRGATVTATDASPDAVVFAAHNLALNDLEGDVAQLDWTQPDTLAAGAPWDLVLASDVLYLKANVEALLRALPMLIGARGQALVADPHRSGGRDFLAAARRAFALEAGVGPPRDDVSVYRLRANQPRNGASTRTFA
jgi:predicted nicotinamide N-methyase